MPWPLTVSSADSASRARPMLVPVSAELKMLRYLQERVNKSTKAFDELAPETKSGDGAKQETTTLAKKQDRVHDLMRRLADKLGKESESEGDR